MTDNIRVLPTINRQKVGGDDVQQLIADFKKQINGNENISKCIIIGFGEDGINPVISYGLSKDLPLFEAMGVLEYMKQELLVGAE